MLVWSSPTNPHDSHLAWLPCQSQPHLDGLGVALGHLNVCRLPDTLILKLSHVTHVPKLVRAAHVGQWPCRELAARRVLLRGIDNHVVEEIARVHNRVLIVSLLFLVDTVDADKVPVLRVIVSQIVHDVHKAHALDDGRVEGEHIAPQLLSTRERAALVEPFARMQLFMEKECATAMPAVVPVVVLSREELPMELRGMELIELAAVCVGKSTDREHKKSAFDAAHCLHMDPRRCCARAASYTMVEALQATQSAGNCSREMARMLHVLPNRYIRPMLSRPPKGSDITSRTATMARQENVIYEGDTVICETSDGRLFFQDIKATNCNIRVGKKLTPVKPVIGARYGSIFEEQNKKLVLVQGGLFPDPVAPEVGEFEVPEENNRNYVDTNSAQKLNNHDIAGLRESGASGQEIIQKLVENSETWESKTEFSKQKYLKKKQQKYMPRVRFVKCTAESLCRTYRMKNPSKICNIREDSLGQMLNYANIYATAQVLVVDTCMGLITGAIAERQSGLGRIIAGYEGQQAPHDILRRFNFDKKTLESIHSIPLNAVKFLEVSEDEIPETEPIIKDRLSEEEKKRLEQERIAQYTEEEQKKYYERKAKRAESKVQRQPPNVVRDWVRGQSDSLVIATHYNPENVLLALLPYLKCSRPFVVYCEYLEPLSSLFHTLQKMDSIVDLQLNETWTREYQILPGRTHPEMKMNNFSGYLLTGTKAAHLSGAELRALLASRAHAEAGPSEQELDDESQPPVKKAKTDN